MRRKFSLLLAIVLLLGILAGCGKEADERTLSVFELTLSDEVKAEVQASYIQWYERVYGRTPEKNWIWEDTTSGLIDTYSLNCRYYGTFDDCVVCFWPMDEEAFLKAMPGTSRSPNSQFDLADSHFVYGDASDFHVYTDGSHYTLSVAYNQGLISAEDIAIIAERHRACREDHFSYGSYGDWNVWYVNNREGEKTELKVANSLFHCKTGSAFHVTNGQKAYTLEQAYKKGILTEADIAALAQKHNAWTPTVFELQFTDGELEMLEAAYKQRLSSYTSAMSEADAAAYQEKLWKMDEPLQNDAPKKPNGKFVYYGTFGDRSVWFKSGNFTAETLFELAGSRFYHNVSCTFYVCTEGKLITLQEAYAQGLISAEDIAIVAERHVEYNEE